MPRELDVYRDRTVLITGASGYIAGGLLRALTGVARSLRLLSRSRQSLPQQPNIQTFGGDIRSRELWDEVVQGVDVVFHLAAQTSVYAAADDPASDFEANVLPLQQMISACRASGSRPVVILAGSVTQAGIPAEIPVDESVRDNPVTVYDFHKMMAEESLKFFCRDGALRGACLRLSNVYGPGPQSSSADRGVLNRMIRRALNGESLTLHGDGSSIRDYTYIDDVVRAFLLAGAAGSDIDGRHFLIGSGKGWTLREAFELVARLASDRLGRTLAVDSIPAPSELDPIEFRNFVADTSAFAQATGWSPEIQLEEGIKLTMAAMSSE